MAMFRFMRRTRRMMVISFAFSVIFITTAYMNLNNQTYHTKRFKVDRNRGGQTRPNEGWKVLNRSKEFKQDGQIENFKTRWKSGGQTNVSEGWKVLNSSKDLKQDGQIERFKIKWKSSGLTNVSKDWKVLTRSSDLKQETIFPKDAKVPITVSIPFLIPNEAICSKIPTLTYVVVVHTAPTHIQERTSMRVTWAKAGPDSRTVFLLGATTNEDIQRAIYRENEQFGDIVQGTFIDDYTNLTLKAVMGLRWISEYCRNADFVIKVDDDVFVNMPQVIHHVFPLLAANHKQIVCSAEEHGRIPRIGNSDPLLSKWLMSPEYFKGMERMPMPFCYGFANFYTTSLAVELFEMAKSTPFYRLDDVYVYGILANKVEGVTWKNAGKTFYKAQPKTMRAVKHETKPLVLVGTGTARAMRRLWKAVKNKTI